MGKVFLEIFAGSKLFFCKNCDTFLTSRENLISNRFYGSTGKAFLFNKVVNLKHSEVQERLLITGKHMVRDVFCKNCDAKLGWLYEFAEDKQQEYKEGKVILEKALVKEKENTVDKPEDLISKRNIFKT